MTAGSLPLLAQTTSRVTWELARQQQYSERWHYLLLAGACALILAFVAYMYRRDSAELRPAARYLLLGLRLVALLGILAYYMDLQKRNELKQVHNSRALVLVDTSISMGLHDSESSSAPSTRSRLEQVVAVLDDGRFVEKLREKHEVVLARFDADLNRIVTLDKKPAAPPAPKPGASAAKPVAAPPAKDDWAKLLLPRGVETRFGQNLQQFIHDERSGPVAGVVIFTDGSQNAGIEPQAAIEAAIEAKIPLYPVGIGSARRPANVRASDLAAPARAYPGDSFAITGYLRAQELADRVITVQLSSGPAGTTGQEKLEGAERVTLGASGEATAVRFEVTPAEPGRRTYRFKVTAPPEDSDASDNQQEADVEIVDRQTKVLLVAGGPMRDYIYLRNQLRRDKNMVVDVWLQSGEEGMSQDANQLLDDFPSSAPELFKYDCIVAFDPDWRTLTAEQIDLLERWVAEHAGGLIAVAGPVCTGSWVGDAKLAKMQALYPVEFHRRLANLSDDRYGSETPWPIDFTREGLEAEFLWLAEDAATSQRNWAAFPGVFGHYSVRGAKSGATVYGRYSDPQAGSGDQQPVYFAGQFYGSGRVFYLGSGEIWRLRSQDEGYFEQFYTKLIRHVSQGRLLLGSSRGMLLVDRDRYPLGSTVAVRVQLSNAQFQPFEAPDVPLQIGRPDGSVVTLKLAADPSRKGHFAGQFTALQAGAYALELAVPDSGDEKLSRRFQVVVPRREQENPERNDALLAEMARRTGGAYYVGAQKVLGSPGVPPLAAVLKDRTAETFLPGVPDQDFQRKWMTALLSIICGALCLEWLIRRLMKLA